MLFIFSTFASASSIKIDSEEQNDSDEDPEPCPAVAMPPGLWNTGFKNGGSYNLRYGRHKTIDEGQSVTIESEICFNTFGGYVIGIPSTADKITIQIKERKNGGSWNDDIPYDTIDRSESDSDAHYIHDFIRTYSEAGVYDLEVSAVSYNNARDQNWNTGGGFLYTLTVVVGQDTTKSIDIAKILDRPMFQILNQFLDLERFF